IVSGPIADEAWSYRLERGTSNDEDGCGYYKKPVAPRRSCGVGEMGDCLLCLPWQWRRAEKTSVASLNVVRKAARAVQFPVCFEALESRRMLAVDLLGYHGGDLASNGVNANETLLTPGNVKTSTFGKQFSVPLDGQAYAEPLVKTNVNITTGAN